MIGSFSLSSRQGSLKTLGDRSLDKFGGAAAAYSVRRLKTPRKEQRLLDEYTGAAAAYSLRKLRGGYTADAIRVRRSSDNAEKDIGFINKGELDLDALIDHCTIYDGFVTKWYDQSGNSEDLLQSTATNQPKIVSSGVTITENDKPAIRFDGVDNWVESTAIDVSSTNVWIFSNITRKGTGGGYQNMYIIATTVSSAGSNFMHLYENDDDNIRSNWSGSAWDINPAGNNISTDEQLLVTQGLTSPDTYLYKNGVSLGTVDGGSTYTVTGDLFVGRWSSNYFNGNFQELIIYASDQSSNRSNIETNMNNYHSIYSGGTDSGYCMRVRRSSDNAEKNIGFDDNGDLDIKELEDHCNSTDGFVTTWFDQSGNNKSFLQSTATKQPKIVSNGSTIKVNHKPALNFDNTDDYLWNTSISFGSSQTLFGVQNIVSGSSLYDKLVYISGYDTGQSLGVRNDFLMVGDNGSGSNSYYQSGSPVYYKNGSSVGGTRDNIYDNFRTSEQTLLTITGLNLSTWDELWLNNYDTTWMWSGYTQELVIYGADVSSRRLAIEREMNRYFKTDWKEWTENDKSLAFDGVNDYVTAPIDGTSSGDFGSGAAKEFTISFWVKLPVVTATDALVQWANAPTTATVGLMIFVQSSAIRYYVMGVWGSSPSITISTDTWYHVVLTRTASDNTNRVYINGVEDTENATAGTSTTNESSMGNIYLMTGYYGYIAGNMDEVAIWTSALTAAQVKSIYNKGVSGDLTSLKPVSWWRMGDNDTYPTIKDNGSGGNDGTMTSMAAEDITPYKPAYNNNTIDFDGVNDHVDLGNPTELQLTGAISVSMWVKFTGTQKCGASKEGYAGSGVRGWALWASEYGGTNPQFVIWNGSTAYNNGTSATVVNDGNWHHIVGVYEPSVAIRMYVDGSLSEENTTSIPASMNNLSDSIILGRFTPTYSSGYNFPGNISDVSIFNKALGYSDIQKIWNGGQPGNLSSLEPVGWWRLGAGDVYPTITDYGSGGNNGTMTNMAAGDIELDPVKYSKWSLDFDGVNDHVNLGDIFDYGTFSISAWVKADALSGSLYEGIFSKRESGGTADRQFNLSLDTDNKFYFWLYQSDGSALDVFSNSAISTGTWYHVLAVADGSTLKMYVDGVLQTDTAAYDGTFQNTGSNTRIGVQATNDWTGHIDEVAFWSKSLSLSEIQRIYNDGVPQNLSSLNPEGWWRMGDEDTYPTIKDHGSGSNDGTMTNMAAGDITADTP